MYHKLKGILDTCVRSEASYKFTQAAMQMVKDAEVEQLICLERIYKTAVDAGRTEEAGKVFKKIEELSL